MAQGVVTVVEVLHHKYLVVPGKLVQFSFGSEIAQVYHIGSHKCTLKPETSDNASYTKQWVLKYPGMSFKDLKSTVIRYLLDQSDNEGAEQAAYKITNNAYKANVRQHGIQVLDMEVSTQSIEAVAELKKGSDKLDPLYIYKLNNSAMNGEPDYVMKSSSTMLETWTKMGHQMFCRMRMPSLMALIVDAQTLYLLLYGLTIHP